MFPGLILKAGAKLHVDIQVLGLVRRRANHMEVQPNGNLTGTDLASFIELEFGATSRVSIVIWIYF